MQRASDGSAWTRRGRPRLWQPASACAPCQALSHPKFRQVAQGARATKVLNPALRRILAARSPATTTWWAGPKSPSLVDRGAEEGTYTGGCLLGVPTGLGGVLAVVMVRVVLGPFAPIAPCGEGGWGECGIGGRKEVVA
jgi:hypothetical protein